MSTGKEYPKFKVNTFINLDLDQLASDIMEIVDIAQVITLLDFGLLYFFKLVSFGLVQCNALTSLYAF